MFKHSFRHVFKKFPILVVKDVSNSRKTVELVANKRALLGRLKNQSVQTRLFLKTLSIFIAAEKEESELEVPPLKIKIISDQTTINLC